MPFHPGQRVAVRHIVVGSQILAVFATVLGPACGGRVLLEDEAGVRFEAEKRDVFPSREALEAAIPNLARSTDLTTGRTTRFL